LDLDGIVSCSVVSDPDLVTENFNDTGVLKESLIPAAQFWASEYNAGQLPPESLENLVIYELHVGSLGYPSTTPGTFTDAMAFIDKLVDLDVNAVELLPFCNSTAPPNGATALLCSSACRPVRAAATS
jgi:1,4-alpha-glucan branching enzyme